MLRAQEMALVDWLGPPQSGSPTRLPLRFTAWEFGLPPKTATPPQSDKLKCHSNQVQDCKKSWLIPPTPNGAYLEKKLRTRRRADDQTNGKGGKVIQPLGFLPFDSWKGHCKGQESDEVWGTENRQSGKRKARVD